MSYTYELEFGGRNLRVVLDKLARQADGAVWVQYGETVLHLTACSNHEAREGLDFLPLSVDYRERLSAAGKIPGGFFKREGKPNESEVLNARIIDRPIRPLFPDDYAYETQIMAMVLSADRENDAAVLGPIAASLALNISDIPFAEAIASVRVGLLEGKYIVNPTLAELENSRLSMIIVGSYDAITMVEGHAKEVSNEELIDAIFFGHEYIKRLVEFQREIIKLHAKPKREFTVPELDQELIAQVTSLAMPTIIEISNEVDKSRRKDLQSELTVKLTEQFATEDPEREKVVKQTIYDLLKNQVRHNILKENRRIDGRTETDIRNIEVEVGVLPRSHGSALFTRGQTQALATVTLGTKLDEQRIETLDEVGFRKFMLHYNFPPFATGEVKNSFGVSRREVGHGKLGERALEAVMPVWEEFPYTVRIVSDIMESNGSSSMATVCAGSLALMDAGVPISKSIAGIAMGLIIEGDEFRILTDILGDEDHLGDMDFKVAGSRDGITSFQMDIKVEGISADLMATALNRARDARHHILDIMDAAISKPREDISKHAPKFLTIKIPVDRIGALIGPGGKNIREIITVTGTTIDVDDDGTVRIGAADNAAAQAAQERIEALTEVPTVGKIYEGTIKRIMDFGAFVEIIPGVEGLMHISEIDRKRVEKVSDYFKIGDKVQVKLQRLDPDGKMDLSRKALLPPIEGQEEPEKRFNRPPNDRRPPNRGGNRR